MKEEFIYGLLRSDFLYYLPLKKQSVVLDAGCGFGTHVFTISPFVGEVYGSDASEKNIMFCEERKGGHSGNIRFIHSSIDHLSFPQGFFDVIIAHEHDDLSRLSVFLKSGGVMYFGVRSSKERNRCMRALFAAGFENEPDVHLAYPSHEFPRFLIPMHDAYALKFILRMMSADKGVRGMGIRFLMHVPVITFFVKRLFFDYAIFIKK